ncbi:MAG: hypothetical protein H0W88_03950 [Parachlamydiaceae bacterium]|nr:hypothetical protein [Parachlamydiaceae bacterium]
MDIKQVQTYFTNTYNTCKQNAAHFFSNRNNVIACVALTVFASCTIALFVFRKKPWNATNLSECSTAKGELPTNEHEAKQTSNSISSQIVESPKVEQSITPINTETPQEKPKNDKVSSFLSKNSDTHTSEGNQRDINASFMLESQVFSTNSFATTVLLPPTPETVVLSPSVLEKLVDIDGKLIQHNDVRPIKGTDTQNTEAQSKFEIQPPLSPIVQGKATPSVSEDLKNDQKDTVSVQPEACPKVIPSDVSGKPVVQTAESEAQDLEKASRLAQLKLEEEQKQKAIEEEKAKAAEIQKKTSALLMVVEKIKIQLSGYKERLDELAPPKGLISKDGKYSVIKPEVWKKTPKKITDLKELEETISKLQKKLPSVLEKYTDLLADRFTLVRPEIEKGLEELLAQCKTSIAENQTYYNSQAKVTQQAMKVQDIFNKTIKPNAYKNNF